MAAGPAAKPERGAATWPGDGVHRIPYAAYTRRDVYEEELARLFYRGHWCYVGLEAEIPNAGDFKRTAIGERSVVMARDRAGAIHVVENVCAHRGVAFCRENFGNRGEFTCPYHQWTYALDGRLLGVPLMRGVKSDGVVQGGMPQGFRREDHGLQKLAVAVRNGVDDVTLVELFGWSEAEFHERLAGSAIHRIGYERWLRNLAVGLGNAPGSRQVLAALHSRRDHPSVLVRDHVAWALSRFTGRPRQEGRARRSP